MRGVRVFVASVSAITPHLRALQAPAPLCELPAWLMWRREPRYENDPKPLKVPVWCDGTKRYGQQGGSHDRSKLTTFMMAREAAVRQGASGLGFALLPEWGVSALDFDNCVGPNGELPAEVEYLAARTYTEYSPSGNGIRAFVYGDLGNHKTPTTPDQFGFETFNTSGFVTLTGNILPSCDILGYHDKIAQVDQYIVDFCERRFSAPRGEVQLTDDFMAGHEPRLGLSIKEIEDLLDQIDPGMGRDDWVRVGMALHHETDGDDTGLEIWNEWSSDAHNYIGREDLEAQWDSFERRKGSGRAQVTMASVKKMAKDAAEEVTRGLASVAGVEARAEVLTSSLAPSTGFATPADYAGKFTIVSAATVVLQPPTDWLIKGVVPAADLIVLYGASTAGKSFIALDMAAAIARGVEWRGRRSRRGRVLVIAAEGGGGYGGRIQAYCQFHSLQADELDVSIMHAAPNVLDADDIGEIVAAIRAAGGFDFIIIDTLAQVTPGANENAGEDMGRALANIQVIRKVSGATIMVIHHAGKDLTRGSRGWSGIRAAADAEIEVSRDEVTNAREIRLSKMKDGQDGTRWAFKLETLVIGMDSDGDELTSCVIVEAEVQAREPDAGSRKGIKRRGRTETHIVEMLHTVDHRVDGIELQRLVTMCAEALPPPEPGKRDTRRQTITRAIHTLSREKESPIAVTGNKVIFFV